VRQLDEERRRLGDRRHHDLTGLKDTRHMKSWNSSHGSRGCSQENLKASGGAGLIYCFVAN